MSVSNLHSQYINVRLQQSRRSHNPHIEFASTIGKAVGGMAERAHRSILAARIQTNAQEIIAYLREQAGQRSPKTKAKMISYANKLEKLALDANNFFINITPEEISYYKSALSHIKK